VDRSIELISHSPEETFEIAKKFGENLPEGAVLCFFGDLAAGKTTFIKGVVLGAADYPAEWVSSPTFVFLNIYEGRRTIYHFDLYRLSGEEQFLSMGFDQFLHSSGITCIEWSEKIASMIPKDAFRITLSPLSETERAIEIAGGVDG
jgi:tRNA threonylcarbamoyladenosine biosynthesis protein TsaE